MADRMSPDLDRRLGTAVQAMTMADRTALIADVETYGATTEGPGDLAYEALPEDLRARIDAGIEAANAPAD